MNFSVLMSVYKNDIPKNFRLALESVSTNQTLKPNQIVIIQDGPLSNAYDEIIDDIKAKENQIVFTILKKDKNEGLAAALNDGLRLCDNEYIARMDADDIAVNDRFEIQMEMLKNDPRIDILGGYIVEFVNDPDIVGNVRTVGLTHDDIVRMAKHRTPFNHMTVVFKKTRVLEAGGYSTEFGKLEDYKLWVDMISRGCFCANIPRVLIKMRVGNGLIERRSNPSEIKDWDRLQKYLLDGGIVNRFESLENRIYIRAFIYLPPSIKRAVYRFILRK